MISTKIQARQSHRVQAITWRDNIGLNNAACLTKTLRYFPMGFSTYYSSGTLIEFEGRPFILTARHCFMDDQNHPSDLPNVQELMRDKDNFKIEVLIDGKTIRAEVFRFDPNSEISLLSVTSGVLRSVNTRQIWDRSLSVKPHDDVLVNGFIPDGLEHRPISTKMQLIQILDFDPNNESEFKSSLILQLDGTAMKGMSGGSVIHLPTGRIIGMATSCQRDKSLTHAEVITADRIKGLIELTAT